LHNLYMDKKYVVSQVKNIFISLRNELAFVPKKKMWQYFFIKSVSVLANPDFTKYPAIQNMPINSAICDPGNWGLF